MKKPVKITLISLLSLLGALLLAVCVLLWLVFTPSRLTPIVNKMAAKYIQCDTRFEEVDVTFFSTFPHVSLHVKNVELINPMQGAPTDTLARIEEVVAAMNVRKFLKDDSLELRNVHVKGGRASLFVRADSCSNFDIFPTDTTEEDTSSAFPFAGLSTEKVVIEGLNVDYLDETMQLCAKLEDLNARIKAAMTQDDIHANMQMEWQQLQVKMEDSTNLLAELHQLQLHMKGEKRQDDISGKLQIKLPQVTVVMDSLRLFDSSIVELEIPLEYRMDEQKLDLGDARIQLDQILLQLKGSVKSDTGFSKFDCDLQYDVPEMPVSALMPWVDRLSPDLLEGIELSGRMALAGEVTGCYADEEMPKVEARLKLNDACLELEESLPAPLTNLTLEAETLLDLNDLESAQVEVTGLNARFRNSILRLKGRVGDLFEEIACQLHIAGDIQLTDAQLFVPEDMQMDLHGTLQPDLDAVFTLEELENFDLKKIKANGTLSFSDLDVNYDSLTVFSEKADVMLRLPSPSGSAKNGFKELLQADVQSSGLQLQMIEGPAVETGDAAIKLAVSNFMDTTRLPSVHCDFDFASLSAVMDTIVVSISRPQGEVLMLPSAKDAFSPAISCNYRHAALSARMGSFLKAVTRKLSLDGKVVYDSTRTMVLDQWDPHVKMQLGDAYVVVEGLDNQVEIPNIRFNFTPEKCDVQKAEITLGQSTFNLSGLITNIGAFLRDEAMMKGNLKLESEYVDVNYLMDLFSGMNIGGDADTTVVPEGEEDPFMVPLGMDVTLETHVSSLLVGETIVENLAGQLSVKDGTLILEEMGFTSDAAKMQLTALYQSPRRNNLFVFLDFHLLDISIADMIEMIPDIDTIVPMLKTFSGNAEFHLSAQTNLKSNYDIKYSTLRGAMSIHGNDLVVLDNETFNTISKYLMFKKKTENKVDSIDVEMTVFKREVELYPFRIAIDKYQALVSGHYIIKENYDCHLSLVESPLPVRLGLKVYGAPDKMKYRLEKPKYSHLYKPEKRNVTEEEVIRLKQMITNSLRSNVKQ